MCDVERWIYIALSAKEKQNTTKLLYNVKTIVVFVQHDI